MDDHEDDWSADEEERFRTLARSVSPGRHLEERVVGELKRRGLLGPRVRSRSPWWLTAIAASLAIFFGGFAAGQWSGSRSATTGVLTLLQEANATERAALVQQTGAHYVAALAALADLRSEESSEAWRQGREAALVALYSSVAELARVDPDNGEVARLMNILAEPAGAQGALVAATAEQLIWF